MNITDLEILETKYRIALEALKKIEYHNTYPYYPNEISEFMNWLMQPPWGDYGYDPSQVSAIFASIDTANISQIRSVLTATNRAERFSDGAWKATLEERKLDPVFKRLKELINGQ